MDQRLRDEHQHQPRQLRLVRHDVQPDECDRSLFRGSVRHRDLQHGVRQLRWECFERMRDRDQHADQLWRLWHCMHDEPDLYGRVMCGLRFFGAALLLRVTMPGWRLLHDA